MKLWTALCTLLVALLVLTVPARTTYIPPPPASVPEKKAEPVVEVKLPAANPTPAVVRPSYKWATTTVFWVGEDATSDNGFIANHASYFDPRWVEHFGGTDTPKCRAQYHPCEFTPLENPFYIALPYGVRDEPLKNRWLEIVHDDVTCYGQWQDVGPFETGDWEYVFGTSSQPTNTVGTHAGLDVSPALRDCLGIVGVDYVEWRFVEESDVPNGPWKDIVTTRESAY